MLLKCTSQYQHCASWHKLPKKEFYVLDVSKNAWSDMFLFQAFEILLYLL